MSWVMTTEVTPISLCSRLMSSLMASARIGSMPGRGLVVEDDLRPVGDGPGQADALPHPAASSWGIRSSIPRRPDLRQALRHDRADLLGRVKRSCAPGRRPRSRRRSWSRTAPRPGTASRTCRVTAWRSSSSSGVTSVPSMKISPASGLRSPIRCLRRTLLPEPLCPMTTIVSPFRISRSTPVEDLLRPEGLVEADDADHRLHVAGRNLLRKKLRIRMRDAGDDDRPGRRPADALGPALGLQALPAADDGDEDAEDRGLDQARDDVPELEIQERVAE